jgi:glutamate dehydrogenase
MARRLEERRDGFAAAGAPDALAARLALLGVSELVPDIASVATAANARLARAAEAYFAVTGRFRIGRIGDAIRSMATHDYYDGLALARAGDMIASARRRIAVSALRSHGRSADPVAGLMKSGGVGAERLEARISDLVDGAEPTVSRLTVAAGVINDLAALGERSA